MKLATFNLNLPSPRGEHAHDEFLYPTLIPEYHLLLQDHPEQRDGNLILKIGIKHKNWSIKHYGSVLPNSEPAFQILKMCTADKLLSFAYFNPTYFGF